MDILVFLLIAFVPIFLTIRKQNACDREGGILHIDYTNCLHGVAILLIMVSHIMGTMRVR